MQKKEIRLKLFIVCIFLLWIMVYGPWTINAAVPHLINYQGKLTDKAGKPLDGAKPMTFRIYNVEAGGVALWEEVRDSVIIGDGGVVSVMLGEVETIDLKFDEDYYLEIQVGSEVLSPRQQLTSVGYAMMAEVAETANIVKNADTVDGYDTATVAAEGKIPVMGDKGYLPANSVDATALKTAVGEVQGGNCASTILLPGGEYGFYPQVKVSRSSLGYGKLSCVEIYNAFYNIDHYAGVSPPADNKYRTYISFDIRKGGCAYIQQRYITSSGEDYWIFLLVDKKTKEIINSYQAPDHPSYGNGGDYNETPHPFGVYNENKIIVLIEKDQAKELQEQATEEIGVAQIINENYKVDFSKEYDYIPLHSGKYIDEEGKQVKHLVENIPDYISVRRLIKLTDTEKRAKEEQAEQLMQQYEQQKAQEEQKRRTAVSKLEALGLTEEDIKLLMSE